MPAFSRRRAMLAFGGAIVALPGLGRLAFGQRIEVTTEMIPNDPAAPVGGNVALNSNEVRASSQKQGFDALRRSPDELTVFVDRELNNGLRLRRQDPLSRNKVLKVGQAST